MRTEPTFFIKQYGDNKHMKLIYMPYCKKRYIEEKSRVSEKIMQELKANRTRVVNDRKLENNLSRAKSKVRELVLCNDFEYFVTLTLSPNKIERTDLKKAITKLNRVISDMNKGREERVRYVLIPERHKSGAWHFHGFLHGLCEKDIRINKNGYKEWMQYADKMGYTNLTPLQNKDKAASYCLKYITKDLARSVQKRGAHVYYASKGLKKAEVIYRGTGMYDGKWDYEQKDGYCYVADYCKQEVRENFYTMIEETVFPRGDYGTTETGFFTSYMMQGGIKYEKIYSGFPGFGVGGWHDFARVPSPGSRNSTKRGIWRMVDNNNVQFVWNSCWKGRLRFFDGWGIEFTPTAKRNHARRNTKTRNLAEGDGAKRSNCARFRNAPNLGESF